LKLLNTGTTFTEGPKRVGGWEVCIGGIVILISESGLRLVLIKNIEKLGRDRNKRLGGNGGLRWEGVNIHDNKYETLKGIVVVRG